MPDQSGGYPAPLSPMFIWGELKATRSEYDRRLDALTLKLEQLDQHGTRGVEALRLEVQQLRKDLLNHEDQHRRQADAQVSSRRWFVGVMVTLLVPLYPLLGYIIVRMARG